MDACAIVIRQAEDHDLDQLCRNRNTEQLFKEYLQHCDGERAHFLVAEIDRKIVGFGLVYLDTTNSEKKKSHLPKLSDLYVFEDYRRRGVATALIYAREALAREYGHAHIYVSIDPVESGGMVTLAKKLHYQPLQAQPYPVCAVFHDADGQAYEKHYTRIDFIKQLY